MSPAPLGRVRLSHARASLAGLALLCLCAGAVWADDAAPAAAPAPAPASAPAAPDAAPAPAPAAPAPAVHFPFLSPAQPNLGIRPLSPEATPSSPLAPSPLVPSTLTPVTPDAASAPAIRPLVSGAPMIGLRPSLPDAPARPAPAPVAAASSSSLLPATAAAPAPTLPEIAASSVNEATRNMLNLGSAMPGAGPSTGTGAVPQNYPIHIGDTLAITMADDPTFSLRATVQNNGTIAVPYIKEVSVVGKTVQDAGADLSRRLGEYYVNPAINVEVAQYRLKQFVILGQVTTPGIYSFSPEQDSMSLFEAIAKAGGVKQYGDMGHVTVKRTVDGKDQIIVVNAREARALSRNQEGLTFQVLPGDSIVITIFRNEINLLGQVRRPGIYSLPPLLDSIDLIEAVALAGGIPDDRDLGIVHVKRVVDGKETSLAIDAKDIGRNKAGANFPVYAGDTLIIEVTANDFIVLGQVNRPGSYQIPPFHDSVDLIEALAMAGGATRLADTSHITIRRIIDGKAVVVKANAQKLSRSADNEHVDVLPGDRIVVSERIF